MQYLLTCHLNARWISVGITSTNQVWVVDKHRCYSEILASTSVSFICGSSSFWTYPFTSRNETKDWNWNVINMLHSQPSGHTQTAFSLHCSSTILQGQKQLLSIASVVYQALLEKHIQKMVDLIPILPFTFKALKEVPQATMLNFIFISLQR